MYVEVCLYIVQCVTMRVKPEVREATKEERGQTQPTFPFIRTLYSSMLSLSFVPAWPVFAGQFSPLLESPPSCLPLAAASYTGVTSPLAVIAMGWARTVCGSILVPPDTSKPWLSSLASQSDTS